MLPTKIIRGDCEVFTPNTKGFGYYYSLKGSTLRLHRTRPWDYVVDMLRHQDVKMIYSKPINKEDWL